MKNNNSTSSGQAPKIKDNNSTSSGYTAKMKDEKIKIIGVDIPSAANVHIGLRRIYGIGSTLAEKVCENVGIPKTQRVYQLTQQQIADITSFIENNYLIEGNKRQEERELKRRLISSGCYRGRRLLLGLPKNSSSKHNSRTVRLLKRRGH